MTASSVCHGRDEGVNPIDYAWFRGKSTGWRDARRSMGGKRWSENQIELDLNFWGNEMKCGHPMPSLRMLGVTWGVSPQTAMRRKRAHQLANPRLWPSAVIREEVVEKPKKKRKVSPKETDRYDALEARVSAIEVKIDRIESILVGMEKAILALSQQMIAPQIPQPVPVAAPLEPTPPPSPMVEAPKAAVPKQMEQKKQTNATRRNEAVARIYKRWQAHHPEELIEAGDGTAMLIAKTLIAVAKQCSKDPRITEPGPTAEERLGILIDWFHLSKDCAWHQGTHKNSDGTTYLGLSTILDPAKLDGRISQALAWHAKGAPKNNDAPNKKIQEDAEKAWGMVSRLMRRYGTSGFSKIKEPDPEKSKAIKMALGKLDRAAMQRVDVRHHDGEFKPQFIEEFIKIRMEQLRLAAK